MGLSGRKAKQRIPNDPRNLGWADDAARFGQTYLSKFGWDSSKGLGVAGDGRISHLKVSQKLDMLGIGAAQQKDPNGIAWKQNRDFENLLRRLNESSGDANGKDVSEDGPKIDGFKAGTQVNEELGVDKSEKKEKKKRKDQEVADHGEDHNENSGKKEKSGKKKRKDREAAGGGEDDAGESTKKERKEKKKRKKETEVAADGEGETKDKKRSKKSKDVQEDSATAVPSSSRVPIESPSSVSSPTPSRSASAKPITLRHRAHRARAIASKSIASKSSSAIAEILGISPSTSSYATPSGFETPRESPVLPENEANDALEKLTTSTKSVSDYFKEKLLLKARSGSTTPVTSVTVVANTISESWDDTPRRGLGSSSFSAQKTAEIVQTETRVGIGMSKFSQTLNSMFLSATTDLKSPNAEETAAEEESIPLVKVTADAEVLSVTTELDKPKEKRKKRKGKEREVDGESPIEHQKPDPTEETTRINVSEGLQADGSEKKEKKRSKKRKLDEGEGEATPADGASGSGSKEERRRKKANKKSRDNSES